MAVERYTRAIIYLVVVVWMVVFYFNNEEIKSAWFRYLSILTTIVLSAVMAFDIWLWKFSLFRVWLVKRPVIEGTWKAEIRSNWVNPTTKLGIAPIQGYMVIRQTLSTLSMRLLTPESTSELVGTEIVCSADGLYCVSGVYRNEPRLPYRQTSAIHYGAVWLKVAEDSSKRLVGHYWTDRGTAGELDLSDQHKKRFQTFQAAHSHWHSKTVTEKNS
jgi:hypothetical protein